MNYLTGGYVVYLEYGKDMSFMWLELQIILLSTPGSEFFILVPNMYKVFF